MNTFDETNDKKSNETEMRELLLNGQKLQAVQLVMQQTNKGLREAKEYVDTYCLQENIGDVYTGPSYSATTEHGTTVYYKTENGEKRIISKEEAPARLVATMENGIAPKRTSQNQKQKDDSPNHRKGRRILTFISLPFAALCLFFLAQIFIRNIHTFDTVGGAIASSGIVISVYFIVLLLWLDETTARRRKRQADETEIPASFVIAGKKAKATVFIIDVCFAIMCAAFLFVSVMAFMKKEYALGIGFLCLFLFTAWMTVSECIDYGKNTKLSLYISGDTISLCRANDEIALLPAATTNCIFKQNPRMRRGIDSSPHAFLQGADGSPLAEIFVDLPEYHLLKKYLIQQGASVTDQFNRY